mmetsp:Transcript_37470/g.116534  ORF Transcript_37470/g.116534 Transcript_37470/m.116534 type:complete len:268 (+) Transcript_37470:376-1179(+)
MQRVWRNLGEHHAFPEVWRAVGKLAEARTLPCTVLKVESHCSPEDIALGYSSPFLTWGNGLADARARAAAEVVQVPERIVEANLRLEKGTQAVLNRLAATVAASLAGAPKEKQLISRAKVPRYSVKDVERMSGHTFVKLTGYGSSRCTVCCQVAPAKGHAAWLRTHPCTGPLSRSADGTVSHTPGVSVALGANTIHATHGVYFDVGRGAWSCTRCRASSVVSLKLLALPCARAGAGGSRPNRPEGQQKRPASEPRQRTPGQAALGER